MVVLSQMGIRVVSIILMILLSRNRLVFCFAKTTFFERSCLGRLGPAPRDLFCKNYFFSAFLAPRPAGKADLRGH